MSCDQRRCTASVLLPSVIAARVAAPKAVSTLVSYVTKSGGGNVGSLLAGALK